MSKAMEIGGVVLEPIEPPDVAELVRLYRTYRRSTYTIEKITELISTFPAYCLKANGKIIAFCYTSEFAPDIIEISSLLVAQDWRNKGLGSKLLSATESEARQRGYDAAILSNSLLYETLESKRRATTFYERLGYREALRTANTTVFVRALR